MVNITKGQLSKAGYVSHLEVLTQEFPMSLDEVQCYCLDDDKLVVLAHMGDNLIGYMLLSFARDAVYIDSIGIHPLYRRKEFGKRLIEHADELAKDLKLRILVPSYQVEDKEDPWCIEYWLWVCGFKAVNTLGPCVRYGHEYEYYVFERMP